MCLFKGSTVERHRLGWRGYGRRMGAELGRGGGGDLGVGLAEGLNNGTHRDAGMHKWAHRAPWKIAAQALRPRCSHMFYSAFSLLCPALLLFWENIPS